jgi:uncharacterized protein (DUF1810 family)
MGDHFDLDRFVRAQDSVYPQALAELRHGRKRSHWMWFIFPQAAGLGRSPTAQFYALSSLAEAKAYLDHPLLGVRLRECTGLVLALEGRSAHEVFGSPDDLKFRSSMTLFAKAAEQNSPFQTALDRYFDGAADRRTLDILDGQRRTDGNGPGG